MIDIKPDIILIQSPVWGINMPPMSLASISRYLRINDITTKILDLNIEEYHRAENKAYWINEKAHFWMEEDKFEKLKHILKIDFRKTAQKIIKENPMALGFSVSAASRFYSFELIKEIKSLNKNIKIILGGKGIWLPEERDYFKKYADFFVIGEGEETILELMEGIKKGDSIEELSKIRGLKTSQYPKRYSPRPLLDLKKLPFPTYEELDLARYTEKTIGMRFSQGCIANCGFCEDKPFQGHYRTREPLSVYNELRYHRDVNGINHFWFHDLAINGDYEKLEELCGLIIENNLDIKWIALAIARKDMPRRLLDKMAEAGCYTLNFGIESGSNSVLRKMNKYEMFSVEDAERIMRWTSEAGINVQPNFIVGYPGETEEEFQETLEFIKKNKKIITGITNINTCILPKRAPIGLTSNRLEIDDTHPVKWKQGELTYDVRLDRAERAYKFVKQLGYDVYFSNLSQTDEKKGDNTEVFLIMCPPWDVLMPPLGIAYLASNLKESNLKTKILDLNIDLFDMAPNRHKKMWHMENYFEWTERNFHETLFKDYKIYLNEIIGQILNNSPVLVGLSINAANYKFSTKLVKILKKNAPDIKICIGGPNIDNTHIWEMEIKDHIDFAVIGESEFILPKVVSRLKHGQSIDDLPGILIIDRKKKFQPWTPIKNLDRIKPPTFLEFDLRKYKEKAIPIMASRGCVARCNFCLDWMYRADYKSRSARNVVDEIEMHIKNHDIRKFNFRDLIINGNLRVLEDICDYIIARRLKINWSAQGTVNSKMSDKLLWKMKKSGFTTMVFGVESCSDTVLKEMNKPFRMKHLKNLLPRIHKAGITVYINLIVGYPGENEKEFRETYEFIKDHAEYIHGISSMTPCLLLGDTNLTKKIEKYDIKIPEKEGFLRWQTKENTYEIRKERVKKLVRLCKKMMIITPLVNLYDEEKIGNKNTIPKEVKKKSKILSW